MYTDINTYIQINTCSYIYIYIIHIYIYTYTYTHTYNPTHIHLFVISFDMPHTQISYHVATSRLNPNKSQITDFHKMRNTRARNPKTESSKKVNKSGLK